MLKILVVDDEQLVRQGIQETINWKEYNIEIVGEAQNGVEALRLAEEYYPDIVITDVRMPMMDGLKFIEHLRNMERDVEIVILSGFDEFNYVKKAIDNGASAYLLKPIKNHEFIDIILKLKDKIERRRESTATIKNFENSIPILKDRFLHDFVLGKVNDPKIIKEKLALFKIRSLTSHYCVLFIEIDDYMTNVEVQSSEECEMFHNRFIRSLDICLLSGKEHYSIHFSISEGKYIVILYIEHWDKHGENSLITHCNRIKKECQSNYQYTLTIGISHVYSDWQQVHKAFTEAMKAVEFKSIVGKDRIITVDEVSVVNKTALNYPKTEIENIIRMVQKGDKEKTFQYLDVLFDYLLKVHRLSLESVQEIINELMILLIRTIFKTEEDIQSIFGKVFMPNSEVRKIETVPEVFTWTKLIFEKILDHPMICQKYNYRKEIQEAIQMIMKLYQSGVTVEQVAEELFISPYYLMHLFRQEVGKTFNEYLTDYRIEVAKEMLKDSKFKIYEIGEKVGYKSTKYFSQTFKKVTGQTPSEYVEENSKGIKYEYS